MGYGFWDRLLDRAADRAAWLLPRRLVRHCAIRLWAHGTTPPWGDTVAGELTVDEALRRWDR